MKLALKLLGLFLCLSPCIGQGVTYKLQDLGTLSNILSIPSSINNQNTVVGYTEDPQVQYDFSWTPIDEMTCFVKEPTYQNLLINNLNQIVGIYWYKTNNWFFSDTQSKHVFMQDADGSFHDFGAPKEWNMQELDDWQTPSAWDTKEISILAFNDLGQILLVNSHDHSKVNLFAIYQNGVYKHYDSKTLNAVYALNNQGIILGKKLIKDETGIYPMLVLYDIVNDTFQTVMKDVNFVKYSFNDRGQIGLVQTNGSLFKGLLWDPELGTIDLNAFLPLAINNNSQMAGVEMQENGDFVYQVLRDGKILNLNAICGLDKVDSIWKFTALKAINDNGYIIGQGIFDGKSHGFLLVPVEGDDEIATPAVETNDSVVSDVQVEDLPVAEIEAVTEAPAEIVADATPSVEPEVAPAAPVVENDVPVAPVVETPVVDVSVEAPVEVVADTTPSVEPEVVLDVLVVENDVPVAPVVETPVAEVAEAPIEVVADATPSVELEIALDAPVVENDVPVAPVEETPVAEVSVEAPVEVVADATPSVEPEVALDAPVVENDVPVAPVVEAPVAEVSAEVVPLTPVVDEAETIPQTQTRGNSRRKK